VTFHVSQPCNKTDFALLLKRLSLVLLEMFLCFETGYNWIKVPFSCLVYLLTSSSAPPVFVTILHLRYKKECTCSIFIPFSMSLASILELILIKPLVTSPFLAQMSSSELCFWTPSASVLSALWETDFPAHIKQHSPLYFNLYNLR
jgi:hypothetical protein